MKRPLSAVCLVYGLLILYGSLMPFDFHGPWAEIRARFDGAFGFWPFGDTQHTSKTDLLSNCALYVPLGLLWATRRRLHKRASWTPAVGGATLLALGVGLAAETSQLFLGSRIASAQDVLSNTVGGLVGGLAGASFGRRAWLTLRRQVGLRWADRPESLLGPLLLVLLAADALFPFLPTLEVAEVVRSLRRSHLDLTSGLAEHPWHYWLVQRAGVYAVLALALAGWGAARGRRRWLYGAAVAAAFAAGAEVCKPLIVGRSFNAANIVVAVMGIAAGAVAGLALGGRLPPRARPVLAAGLLALYLGYLEWSPFAFTWSPPAMAAKWPVGAQWLPLYHYAMGARAEDVRLFVRTVVLSGGLVCAACLGGLVPGRLSSAGGIALAAAASATLGLVLELGQFLLPGRVPSTTDVFCFALGGALGAWVASRRGAGLAAQVSADAQRNAAGQETRRA